MPGLLQTRAYATSIVEQSLLWPTKREATRFVDLRMARQDALTRDDPLSMSCILDEAALRREVGGPAVMKPQLERVLEVMGSYDHVDVRVLPFSVGAHAALDGTFQLMHFPVGPPVALVESKTTSLYLEEDGDVDLYRSAFKSLLAKALDAKATHRFIHELIKDCFT